MGDVIDLNEEFDRRRELNDLIRPTNARVAYKLAMFEQQFFAEVEQRKQEINRRKHDE